MDADLSQITVFIQQIPPFDLLSPVIINRLVRKISICYLKAGETLPPKGTTQASLYILRKGALSYLAADKKLIAKYGEGDLCTVYCRDEQSNLSNKGLDHSTITVIIEEDALLYTIDYLTLKALVKDTPGVSDFFEQTAAQRLNKKILQLNEDAILASSLTNTSVKDFYNSPIATISENASIQSAAIKMTTLGFSCLVVVNKTDVDDTPIGIITDKDIRRRCVALGLPITKKVTEIMTRDITTIDIKSNAFDALITMTNKHIHHLPITYQGKLAGIVTVTDLINNEGNNAINLTSIIMKAQSVNELVEISQLLTNLQIKLTKLGASADHIGKSISAITMAFTSRLINMAEKIYGESPVPYAWLAGGSQARQEQLVHSDQDNALIISDDMKPEDDAWFKKLAKFVCDGLANCGFIYCPGNVMATNSKWRQPQSQWQHYFDQWIDTPDPSALLFSSIFFDLTTVYGDAGLLDPVRKKMLAKTQRNTLFIAHLSTNALSLPPPLGFFRDFVLIQNGKHKSTLDIKHNGIAPIVDLARIYALSEGISAVNTIERIKLSAGSASLSSSSAANLIDAYQFLTMVRLVHRAKQIQQNIAPDNYISPKEISRLEREHLKDAFKVIKTLQDHRQSTVL
ncbi:MAG: CBS domain-containing protein [Alteromonadaceae bacterium]|jgi:CBS domain-containing protein|tara:strand:+ start:1906 stop:3792 length:1887 start_codon:yes stop_codon:yes gene_type:complete